MSNNTRENNKIANVLATALIDQRFVTIKIYNHKGDNQFTGLITQINPVIKRVKLSHEKDSEWVQFARYHNRRLY